MRWKNYLVLLRSADRLPPTQAVAKTAPKKTATLSFRNPKKPSVFYLHADGAYTEPQTLAIKVNGQQAGGLYNCINRVMRGMQFPKINGPRTRAEFDIGV